MIEAIQIIPRSAIPGFCSMCDVLRVSFPDHAHWATGADGASSLTLRHGLSPLSFCSWQVRMARANLAPGKQEQSNQDPPSGRSDAASAGLRPRRKDVLECFFRVFTTPSLNPPRRTLRTMKSSLVHFIAFFYHSYQS